MVIPMVPPYNGQRTWPPAVVPSFGSKSMSLSWTVLRRIIFPSWRRDDRSAEGRDKKEGVRQRPVFYRGVLTRV